MTAREHAMTTDAAPVIYAAADTDAPVVREILAEARRLYLRTDSPQTHDFRAGLLRAAEIVRSYG